MQMGFVFFVKVFQDNSNRRL